MYSGAPSSCTRGRLLGERLDGSMNKELIPLCPSTDYLFSFVFPPPLLRDINGPLTFSFGFFFPEHVNYLTQGRTGRNLNLTACHQISTHAAVLTNLR